MALSFNVSQPVWVVCHGHFDADPYGLYAGTISRIDSSSVTVVCLSYDLELTANWNAVSPGVKVDCTSAPGGENKASLMPRDANFPPEVILSFELPFCFRIAIFVQGYADMTNMSQLNDAELAKNLITLYQMDKAYVTH